MQRFKDRRRLGRQRMQIRRLQLVHELAKLEQRYHEEEAGPPGEFDPSLVRALKREEWYLVAKHTAEEVAAAAARDA